MQLGIVTAGALWTPLDSRDFDGSVDRIAAQVQMVAIKNGTVPGVAAGGGHDAFNLARAIDAFSARTLRYKGDPNEDVWQSIKVGALLEVDFEAIDFSKPKVLAKLVTALGSGQCRVRVLR